jgi:ankyrin repeat protein
MLRRTILAGALALAFATTPQLSVAQTMSELPLHQAAAANNAAAISQLLATGADIEARNDKGETALLVATHADNVEAAAALIAAGADVNAKDGIEGHLEILRLTLAHGADLKSINRYGGTALIPAAERGHVETVHTLIDAGIDVDHINRLGWTALLEAIILADGGQRHQEIVDLLIKAEADVDLPDFDGTTPLQHARSRGFKEIEAALLAAGAK